MCDCCARPAWPCLWGSLGGRPGLREALRCWWVWQDAFCVSHRWVFIYEKGYQSSDTAVSSVFSKMKGVGYTNVNGAERVWDVADYVFPPQVRSPGQVTDHRRDHGKSGSLSDVMKATCAVHVSDCQSEWPSSWVTWETLNLWSDRDAYQGLVMPPLHPRWLDFMPHPFDDDTVITYLCQHHVILLNQSRCVHPIKEQRKQAVKRNTQIYLPKVLLGKRHGEDCHVCFEVWVWASLEFRAGSQPGSVY